MTLHRYLIRLLIVEAPSEIDESFVVITNGDLITDFIDSRLHPKCFTESQPDDAGLVNSMAFQSVGSKMMYMSYNFHIQPCFVQIEVKYIGKDRRPPAIKHDCKVSHRCKFATFLQLSRQQKWPFRST
uniref:AlNc14C348G10882 protein n=1 Tax=Albugo laibachii Nc14 TaxID=890382 RepID=F0WXD0_9STRA|nr:AlNc14C348G10882 [Albugo laibachii Nc14]|eukprot:CCA26122.1 AlNc14C348G10882 [Albugo laibachii Nc14]